MLNAFESKPTQAPNPDQLKSYAAADRQQQPDRFSWRSHSRGLFRNVHCSNPKVREVVSARAVVPPLINCAGTRRRMRSLVQPAAGVDRSNDRGCERRVESEEVGLSPFLRPLAQTARAVFPLSSRALWASALRQRTCWFMRFLPGPGAIDEPSPAMRA